MGPGQVAKIMARLFRNADLTNGRLTPHSCRKYFDTQLIAAGMPESWANILSGRVAERGAGAAYNMPSIKMLRDGPPEHAEHGFTEASKGLRLREPVAEELAGLRANGVSKDKEIGDLKTRVDDLSEELKRLVGLIDSGEMWKDEAGRIHIETPADPEKVREAATRIRGKTKTDRSA